MQALCIEYFLCNAGLKTQSLQRIYEFISILPPRNVAVFGNFSLDITPKELKLSPCIKFHNLFSYLETCSLLCAKPDTNEQNCKQ